LQVIGWEAAIGGAEAPQQADVASKVLATVGAAESRAEPPTDAFRQREMAIA